MDYFTPGAISIRFQKGGDVLIDSAGP